MPNSGPSHEMLPRLQEAFRRIDSIILGKSHQTRLALACLIAGGHLLIEDIPGVGKTTLAQTLAHVLGMKFQRIQFTSDLLPADITGASIYERDSGKFRFHAGPLFSELVLADEVNRATPKTQSALLEAMEERQVTFDGRTYPLPETFFVIATQNPNYQIGTFPLPESQLDRFLMCISLGYPDSVAERALLLGEDRRELLTRLQPALDPGDMHRLRKLSRGIRKTDALLDYIQQLVERSRVAAELTSGISPRGALALLHCAQAWALIEGRDHVLPDDVQAILPGVVNHRLRFDPEHETGRTAAAFLLQSVAIP